ncbi:MAG: SH3 domain-containing protein [Firmicutes bacterium]|nr:SH3 domain-containing protein [Bacillota bacterium]
MKKIKEIYIITIVLLIIGITTSLATAGTISTDGVRMRSAPSVDSKVITVLNNGDKVTIEEKTNGWYKIKYNNTNGYISADYVKADGTVTNAANTANTTDTANTANTANATNTTNNGTANNPNAEAYPQTVTAAVSTKMYIIPSITSSVMAQIDVGKTIIINGKLNNWSYISYDNKSGWIRNAMLQGTTAGNAVAGTTPAETAAPAEAANTTPPATTTPAATPPATTAPAATTPSITKGYVNVASAYVRSTPNTSGKIVTSLLLNTEVKITGEESGWYKITFTNYTGYINKALVSSSPTATSRSSEQPRTANTAPATQTTAAAPEEPAAAPAPAAAEPVASSSNSGVVDTAMQYLGYKYVYGGNSPSGFDCSGFTQYVFKCCGYSLNRTAAAQASNGTPVSRADLQPGDLVLFSNGSGGSIGHVGIYIGGGNMIHAANPSKGVRIDTINSGYYNNCYYGARRII